MRVAAGIGSRTDRQPLDSVYRYRLVEEQSGADLGPFVSAREVFEPGETLCRGPAERFKLVNVVPPENENFRAYLIVRRS